MVSGGVIVMSRAEGRDIQVTAGLSGRRGAAGARHRSAGATGQRRGAQNAALQLAKGLGWFSVALGLAEVLAPRSVARFIGVGDDETNCRVLQGMGLREMAAGLGIVTQNRPDAGWLWARVGGDAIDLSLLGLALASDRNRRERLAGATAAVVGVTALDALCARQLMEQQEGRGKAPGERAIHAVTSVTINRPPEELYRFWRDFRNLPRFMSHLEAVEVREDGRSHWRASGPLGTTVEWDAEIVEERPNELIAWRSLEGADVDNSGSVRFTRGPGGRGAELRVEMRYAPPAGRVGAAIASLLGEDARQQVRTELRRFKALMETGEIPRSEASMGWLMHPARPEAKPAH